MAPIAPSGPLSEADIGRLRGATHDDPFGVLGPHPQADGRWRVRAWLPGARRVEVLEAGGSRVLGELERRHDEGFFEGLVALPDRRYRWSVTFADGAACVCEDPYRFGPMLGDTDAWLLAEGRHLRPYEVLGAHPCRIDGVDGVRFALWAPNARRVSVVGDFNRWDGRCHPMRARRECGVWEIFLPGVGRGALYQFELLDPQGRLLPLKADPYAFQAERRPARASVVAALPAPVAASTVRAAANAPDAPIAIYEVHPGSWRRHDDPAQPFLDWDELAERLVPYAAGLGFTHLELLPVAEHPFDGSWGYQPTGLYAPTSRHGDAQGLRRFVAACHRAGLGVLLDWVPGHFPADEHALARFDGTALYEHADPREGVHRDWNTLIYNHGRAEVRNFLVGNALYWLERFGADGLRVDAVASMLYRDYSREPGQWVPNAQGGRENLEAIECLRRMNEVVGEQRPGAVTIAEESTAFPGVCAPTSHGGLGFHYKWNMGWMNDTLRYIARDPIHRRHHQDELTFGLMYAFSERFVLPISHDEVVHGKGSLLGKMPGDRWQRLAGVRAYLGWMYAHPGKKLLFMGCEFAQAREWRHDAELDWHLLDDPGHAGVQRLVGDLNRWYRETPAMHQRDHDPRGFEWIDHRDADHSIVVFTRHGHDPDALTLVLCHFTPQVHRHYRVGVPRPGRYRERLNTDSAHYGGSNVGSPYGEVLAEAVPCHGRSHSVVLTVPPLAMVAYEWSA